MIWCHCLTIYLTNITETWPLESTTKHVKGRLCLPKAMELHRQLISTEVLIKLSDAFEPLESISYSGVDSLLVWAAPRHIKLLLKVREAGFIETAIKDKPWEMFSQVLQVKWKLKWTECNCECVWRGASKTQKWETLFSGFFFCRWWEFWQQRHVFVMWTWQMLVHRNFSSTVIVAVTSHEPENLPWPKVNSVFIMLFHLDALDLCHFICSVALFWLLFVGEHQQHFKSGM